MSERTPLTEAERETTRTHCANGHEYTPENTRPRPDRGRLCLTCKRESVRRQEVAAQQSRTGQYGLTAEDLRTVNPDRFWSKVVEKGIGCWLWGGRLDQGGYGICFVPGRRTTTGAHRVSWALSGHPLDPKLSLDHLCRNRACVNPEHLEPVTAAENNRRAREARS